MIFEGIFNNTVTTEAPTTDTQSSDLSSTSIDAKVEGIGELVVMLEAGVVVTDLQLSDYQIETHDNLGNIATSINGFFTLSNTMTVDVMEPTVLSIVAI